MVGVDVDYHRAYIPFAVPLVSEKTTLCNELVLWSSFKGQQIMIETVKLNRITW